jgi:predicted RNA-binding Zn ribbon-like protein
MVVRGRRTELLEECTDLINWLVRAKLLGSAEGKETAARLGRGEGERLLDDTKAFRAVLRQMVERIVTGKAIPHSAVEAINRLLSGRHGYPQLVRANGRFERRFHSTAQGVTHVLASLAEAASDLLCTSDLTLVKKCGNAACILYFYDTTKNHARNWCSMRLCGNRMKVAAFFQRKRKNAQR